MAYVCRIQRVVGYDENATAQTLTAVKAFLSSALKLQDTPRN